MGAGILADSFSPATLYSCLINCTVHSTEIYNMRYVSRSPDSCELQLTISLRRLETTIKRMRRIAHLIRYVLIVFHVSLRVVSRFRMCVSSVMESHVSSAAKFVP